MAMSQNMIADRQKQIFDAITMMRGLQPKILPFATCWNQLRQQRPDWSFRHLPAPDLCGFASVYSHF
jgi:hypothetical protein